MNNITISNFPVLDGSDSTSPLRYILMCKLLGFDYEWQASPFIQNPDEAPKQVVPIFTCSEDERRELMTKRLLNSNTHQSFMNLIDNKVEVIITARSISRDEKTYANEQGVTLIEKPIARDALAFMVNLKNPVNNLSIEQIQGIYTGKIVNWSEVGGLDCMMKPYVRNRNSGSQEKFETMVMVGLTIKDFPEMQIGKTMMAPYYQLEQDTAGIAFTPFYYYNTMVGSGSTKAIGVNGVAMTKENIKNDTYPYTSHVYTAVRSDIDKSSMAYRLFEFLTTEEGQAIVDESGYVSLQTVSTGIRSLENESKGAVSGSVASGKDVPIYNFSGQQLKNPNKGINIIGNKKLLMK
jgi:phosphate transport system substrate-binding protein